MKYDILINYDTGDSYGQRPNQETKLDLEISDFEIAKENLQRIKGHYEFIRAKKELDNRYYFGDPKKKAKLEKIIADAPNKPWYVKKYPEVAIILLLDDNKPFQVSSFWCGYFETLNSAEIVQDQSDLKITF